MYEKKRKFFSAIIITALIFSMPMYIYADTGNRTDQSGTLQNISENIVRNVSDQMTIEEFVTGVAEINEKSSGFSLFSSVPKARLIVKAESEPHVSGADEIFGGYDGYYIVVYENEEKAEAGKEELISQDNVECVEQDMELQLSATGGEYTYQTLKYWGKGETDPLGIEYINNAIMEKYGNDVGAMPEVVVAVIDSGVEEDHPFLSGRLTAGINVTSGEMTDVSDTVGHGTSVAGIIADVSLPNVKIMPVRVADDQGKVYASAVIAGVEAAQDAGADVINMSLGGKGKNSVLESAVLEAEKKDIVCVAAAGNNGEDAGEYYPANIDSVVAVSNLSGKESLYASSNIGDTIDLAAPGLGICTASRGGVMTKSFSGTSAAAPFVSAASAIIYTMLYEPQNKEKHPDAEQIVSCLYENAVDIGEPGKDKLFGYGRVNFGDFHVNSDDNNEDKNPDHTGNETSDNLSIRISKTDTGYQAEYKIPEKDSDLIQDNFIICIVQYSIEGKILNVIVRQCVNSYGAVQTKRVENTAETRAFLLSAESCKAAVIYASVSEE